MAISSQNEGDIMKIAVILAILLILVVGCKTEQVLQPKPTIKTTPSLSGTQDLILNEQDLQQLGMASDPNNQDLKQLGITGNGTNCQTDDSYSNIVDTSMGQYTICSYIINSENDTQVIIELQKFADYEALNGSYQYNSLHLFSAQGLISENDFGDQSRFRVNNENDYGGNINNAPNVHYYHLWFTKNEYLIHITSKGSNEAEGFITKIAQQILSKFG